MKLTYLSPEKLDRLIFALNDVNERAIKGSFLEFGVALGGSAIVICSHLRGDRTFHGFDVFSTIPPPTSEKDDIKSKQRYEVIASGRSEGIEGDQYYGYRESLYEDVKAALSKFGTPVDGKRVCLHRGLFEDTLPNTALGSVAFAHIDCDWYDPVRYCLKFVNEKMSIGGVILIDDYNDYGGCKTAVDEFIEKHSNYRLFHGVNPYLVRQG